MFDSLTKRLSGIFEQLTKRGVLKESHIEEALREIRLQAQKLSEQLGYRAHPGQAVG